MTTERDGFLIRVFRAGFRPGYYAEARNAAGERVAFTGVFVGRGSKERAIQAALYEAKTGMAAPFDAGRVHY